ncbi:hypothetical protein HPB48_003909 [Haemaphysalis longicornis]|uniref:PPIase cyclophilin-type domain-containing protein n=1 Tax=Haemaphysalis longicornis TaxID=44386 RepID=A0A9J6FG79_HAELO|nr:hypothetical protein HPB48_003909 [Haemaphysalis longicornis]
MRQGGYHPGLPCAFTNYSGTSRKCIYGNKFDDENFRLKHTAPGIILSTANAAAPTPTGRSSFSLRSRPARWRASTRTVFGSIVEGMEVSNKVEAYGLQTGKTSKKIRHQRLRGAARERLCSRTQPLQPLPADIFVVSSNCTVFLCCSPAFFFSFCSRSALENFAFRTS